MEMVELLNAFVCGLIYRDTTFDKETWQFNFGYLLIKLWNEHGQDIMWVFVAEVLKLLFILKPVPNASIKNDLHFKTEY